MINAVSQLRILPVEPEISRPAAASPDETGSFGDSLSAAMDKVDQLQGSAEEQVRNLLAGGGADVHDAMIAVEQADLSFQLMMQVRNKIVSAYQEISRMQF